MKKVGLQNGSTLTHPSGGIVKKTYSYLFLEL
jgi:hypothetical protein